MLSPDFDIHPLGRVLTDVWFGQFDFGERVTYGALLNVLLQEVLDPAVEGVEILEPFVSRFCPTGLGVAYGLLLAIDELVEFFYFHSV
jgi:hypothetical protein